MFLSKKQRHTAVKNLEFSSGIGTKSLIIALCVTVCPTPKTAAAVGPDVDVWLKLGDSYFVRRAEAHQGPHANPDLIRQAVQAYEQALRGDPQNMEAYWKLLRSLTFEGHYATQDRKEKQRIFAVGKKVAEDGIRVLEGWVRAKQTLGERSVSPERKAELLKGVAGSAETYYYAATIWAEWSLAHGVLAALQQGAAAKIRDFATLSSLIDDHVRYGGGYRALGRLHHKCPRIPFLTGWISCRKALEYLEKAYQIDSKRKFNRVYYAEALYDLDRSRSQEAIRMLQRVIADPPDADLLVEDLWLQEEARALLKTWSAK